MNYETIPYFQCGGHEYEIHLINAYTVDDDNNLGDTHHYKQRIRVALLCSDGTPRNLSSIEETLCHEIVHTVSRVFNADLTEAQVLQTSEGLYQILKQFGLKLVKEV